MFFHVKTRFPGFMPRKLQTVAIFPGTQPHIAKICLLKPFNDKISDYFFLHRVNR